MHQYSAPNYHFCTLNQTQFTKPLPTLDFVQKLLDICHSPMTLFESQQRNRYDRKNHILYINNYESYGRTLKQKYGRSVTSFQKQLKMMGFKKRRIRQHFTEQYIPFQSQSSRVFNRMKSSMNLEQQRQKPQLQNSGIIQIEEQKNRKQQLSQFRDKNSQMRQQGKQKNIENSSAQILQRQIKVQGQIRVQGQINVQRQINTQRHGKYMFVWRTNRMGLIQKQMQDLQAVLQEQVERAIRMKQQVQKRRKQLDNKMQSLLLGSLLNEVRERFFNEIDTNMGVQSGEQKIKCVIDGKGWRDVQLKRGLQQLKRVSNVSQQEATDLVRKISKCSQSQLQLYRALIYKQTHVHRTVDDE